MANDGSNVGYLAAPDGDPPSHLYGFRFRDQRIYTDLPESRLDVVFRIVRRKGDKGIPGTKGYYVCPDAETGQRMYDSMAASGHPYSAWLLPQIIKTGWKWVEVEKVK